MCTQFSTSSHGVTQFNTSVQGIAQFNTSLQGIVKLQHTFVISNIYICRQCLGIYYIEKSCTILVNPNRIWFVIILFRLIQPQTKLRSVLHQMENCNYNRNLVWINQIEKKFLFARRVCVSVILLVNISKLLNFDGRQKACQILTH